MARHDSMTETFKVLILAVLQGVTEFLPISSSGHLALAQDLLGVNAPGVALEVILHAGTLISVLVFYRHRLITMVHQLPRAGSVGRRELRLLIVGVIPIGILGVACRDSILPLFERPQFVSIMLIATGVVLLSLFFCRSADKPLGLGCALVIGLAQALAIIPGVSRSGITIVTARHFGIAPDDAAEFSLLLMIPAVGGAVVLQIGDMVAAGFEGLRLMDLVLALIVSAVVGYFAISCLVRALRSGRMQWFGFYCVVLGIVGWVLT